MCAACRNNIRRKHGQSIKGRVSSEYRIWQMMLDRCYNPNNQAFHHYGGRGVRVCDRWRHDFRAFYADMGPRPVGMEIDRQDNNGNYDPSNCRWVTPIQNQNNKRTNRLLTYQGKTLTLSQWARLVGAAPGALLSRIDRSGMTVEEALSTPFGNPVETRRRNNDFLKITWRGETLTCWQWSERTGILRNTIAYRINAGWDPERALTTPSRQAKRH